MSRPVIKTPCVGLCSTMFGDEVCRGCKRFHHEVVDWNLYGDEERQAVWARLEQLLVQVVSAKLDIFDATLLRQQLQQRQVRFLPGQSEYCWAYQLLVRGARLIQQIEAYGIRILPEFRERPLASLRDAIDKEFFLLSQAHYERYIAPRFLVENVDSRV